MWNYPPAIGEAAAGVFFRPAWGLYDSIQGDKFKHIHFSHDFFFFSCNGLRAGRLRCLRFLDERPGPGFECMSIRARLDSEMYR